MKQYIIKKYPFVDGRFALREYNLETGELGMNLPMTSDIDVVVKSYKYPNMTLGEIASIDKGYLAWVATKSNASDRIKKAAARLYFGVPYVAKKEGDIISQEESYDSLGSHELIKKIK